MKENYNKRVAIYIRCSSEEQKKEGLSLDAQKKKLEEYCEFKKWKIFKIYKDEGISAGSIKKRDEFKNMLNDAKNEKFSTILMTRFDRAFRNVKEALVTLDELKKINVDFVSITEDVDTTTAMGKFFFVIISAFAELERSMTTERNKSIMEKKFSDGLFIARIPFGYNPVYKNAKEKKGIKDIKVNLKEAEIVKDIFLLTSKRISYKVICEKYDLKPQVYYNLIRNKAYVGIVEFQGIEKKGNFEPIISQELFNEANKKK